MSTRKRTKIYVGYVRGKVPGTVGEVVRAIHNPTFATHGNLYHYCVGPFRTLAGAQFCVNYHGPIFQTVAEFEREARRPSC